MATCTGEGSCFVTNDSPRPFDGVVTIRLLNVLTGKGNDINQSVVMAPGATGPRLRWFCATNVSADVGASGAAYVRHPLQLPSPRGNFTKTISGGLPQCEAACNAEPGCLGFTTSHTKPISACWLYSSAPILINVPDADWWQRPGTAPIPAPPPPPPPPAPIACAQWARSAPWADVGCDATGSNCLLQIVVSNTTGAEMSVNTVPFVAPKAMRLPKASVSVSVGAATAGGEVPIELSSDAVALFVVLTTRAAGRFSRNAFLLQGQATVAFLPWTALNLTLLKSTLRVEHLAEALDSRRMMKTTDKAAQASGCDGQLLANGICSPPRWPPATNFSARLPLPPYLRRPPNVINVSCGRQLWVRFSPPPAVCVC